MSFSYPFPISGRHWTKTQRGYCIICHL